MVSRHFLCCLPLRLGVAIISLVQLLISGLAAGALWWILADRYNNIDSKLKAAVILSAISYTIYTIFSGVGFMGTLAKKTGYVSAYARWLGFLFFFQVISCIFYIVSFLVDSKSELLKLCVNNSTNQTDIDKCNHDINVSKWVMVIAIFVPLIISGYGLHIVSSYATQLEESEAKHAMMMAAPSGYQYNPVHTADESMKPLTHPDVTYPYSDASHSFGNTAGGPPV